MTPEEITLDTTIALGTRHISTEIDDEIVLLNAERGFYYAAGETGTRILRLLGTPRTVRQVCAELGSQYDVDAATCERDVLEFVRELAREALVVPSRS